MLLVYYFVKLLFALPVTLTYRSTENIKTVQQNRMANEYFKRRRFEIGRSIIHFMFSYLLELKKKWFIFSPKSGEQNCCPGEGRTQLHDSETSIHASSTRNKLQKTANTFMMAQSYSLEVNSLYVYLCRIASYIH